MYIKFQRISVEIELTFIEYNLAVCVVIIGALLQGSIGFGLGPFSVPLLLLINPVFVPGPLLCIALMQTIFMYFKDRSEVIINDIKWAVSGRIFGSIAGAITLTIIAEQDLSLLFAIVILFSLLIFISGIKLELKKNNLILVGSISGFMGTTTSIGGPPMGLLYQNEKGPRIRGTLSGIFMVGTIISIILLMIIGKLWLKEIILAIVLLPGIFIGLYLSKYSIKFLDKGFLKPVILMASALASIILILRYF
jgi:uncharacterized membrane protein YfcA